MAKKDYSKEVRGRQKNVNNRWCRVCASDANYTTTKYACRISEDSYICARARDAWTSAQKQAEMVI